MYLKQILLFLALTVFSNQCIAQTLFFNAKIEHTSCRCKGTTENSPICGSDVLVDSIPREEQLEPCIFIENIKKDYKRYAYETFEIVLDSKAKILTKKLGETIEVYHIQKEEVEGDNKKHFTFHVTNEKGEKTQIDMNLEGNFITFYYTKDSKYIRSDQHNFTINYSKIYKENEKKN